MNKQDIDNMMSGLPSQQPKETIGQKWLIGAMFIAFVIGFTYTPDIINQLKESTHGNCQENSR